MKLYKQEEPEAVLQQKRFISPSRVCFQILSRADGHERVVDASGRPELVGRQQHSGIPQGAAGSGRERARPEPEADARVPGARASGPKTRLLPPENTEGDPRETAALLLLQAAVLAGYRPSGPFRVSVRDFSTRRK